MHVISSRRPPLLGLKHTQQLHVQTELEAVATDEAVATEPAKTDGRDATAANRRKTSPRRASRPRWAATSAAVCRGRSVNGFTEVSHSVESHSRCRRTEDQRSQSGQPTSLDDSSHIRQSISLPEYPPSLPMRDESQTMIDRLEIFIRLCSRQRCMPMLHQQASNASGLAIKLCCSCSRSD